MPRVVITDSDLLVRDADTLLDADAVAAMRRAFGAEPALVAATGVLFPVCAASLSSGLLQWFQTYEYMRNCGIFVTAQIGER
jgi:cellulose synthase/poly-beta-1,6-N-acetylglucosamine synthase-like glycosyltransferase